MNRLPPGKSTPPNPPRGSKAELDWQPLCRKAVDFIEKTVAHRVV